MTPLVLPAARLRLACQRFAVAYRAAQIDTVLVARGEGRIVLAAADMETITIFCHLPAPLPLTDFQCRLAARQWAADALRFLVPFDLLREAARDRYAETYILRPGAIDGFNGLTNRSLVVWPADGPEVFPMHALPPLTELPEGWTVRNLRPARVNVTALAASAS